MRNGATSKFGLLSFDDGSGARGTTAGSITTRRVLCKNSTYYQKIGGFLLTRRVAYNAYSKVSWQQVDRGSIVAESDISAASH